MLATLVMKMMALSTLTLLLAGCASPAKHFGDSVSRLPDVAERGFRLEGKEAPQRAVRDALMDAGLEIRDNAGLFVQVGFSIRPGTLAVLSTDDAGSTRILSPASKDTISLCNKQAYVLTLAFVDTQSGKLVSRSGATMSRCQGAPAEVLPKLARAALSFQP